MARGTLVPEGTGERRALRLERDDPALIEAPCIRGVSLRSVGAPRTGHGAAMIGRPGLSAHRGVPRRLIALPESCSSRWPSRSRRARRSICTRRAAPGLYNEDHVLRSLDSVLGDLPLPDARWAAFIALLTGATLATAGGRLSAAAFALADSRAPPFA